jgi:serine/threonine protein kinase
MKGRIFDRYKLMTKIGSGAFGEVFQAKGLHGDLKAVKLVAGVRPEDFSKEMASLEIVKRLRHPHLLSIFDFELKDNELYILMELADTSLTQRLGAIEGQSVPANQLLLYFRQTADALDYLHRKTVLHRDVKPDNILILRGQAKLADFGLARIHQTLRSMKMSVSGTPAYMSPECWKSKGARASDQYSLAVAYAELRLGRPPFYGHDISDLALAHIYHEPDLAGLPEAEKEVLLRAMNKSHPERFANCAEFMACLSKASCQNAVFVSADSTATSILEQSKPIVGVDNTARNLTPEKKGKSQTMVYNPQGNGGWKAQAKGLVKSIRATIALDIKQKRVMLGSFAALGIVLILGAAWAFRPAQQPNRQAVPVEVIRKLKAKIQDRETRLANITQTYVVLGDEIDRLQLDLTKLKNELKLLLEEFDYQMQEKRRELEDLENAGIQ